jgi:predicted dehydrogenase
LAKIKTGIIGTGFSAQSHMEALSRVSDAEVIAIASRNREKAEALAERYGIKKAYGRYEDLIHDPEVEVIHNCTANHLHFSLNKMILEAGKHLLSEKPLAISSEESAELAQLAEQKKKVHGVCFNYRHYPMVEEARQAIQSGHLGEIQLVFGGYLQDWLLYPTDYNWRLDPEKNGPSRAMADIGSHWCDTVQHVLGHKVTEVFADLKTVHPIRKKPKRDVETFHQPAEADVEDVRVTTEDCGVVLVHFANGALGSFTISQVNAGRKNKLFFEIAGTKSALAWDQEKPNELWQGFRNEANRHLLRDPALLSGSAASLAHYPGGHQEGWPDGLKNLLIRFYQSVQMANRGEDWKRSRTFADFHDGHQIMKIIDAILKSDREKRWVTVSE